MTSPRAERLLTGRIATLAGEHGFGWVEALATSDGRVLAAGSRDEVEALAGPQTLRWDLPPDLAVVPSLTDAHIHCVDAALAADQPDLTGLDREGVLTALGSAHEALLERGDEDSWLLGHGWTFDALGVHPDATWLDEAAPGRPVPLGPHPHHSRRLSARAEQIGGMAAMCDPPAGRIEIYEEARPTCFML